MTDDKKNDALEETDTPADHEGEEAPSGQQIEMTPDQVRGVIQLFQQVRSGPLPPAEEMKGYAQVDPALPSRILQDAATRRDQRHKLEDLSIRLRSRDFRFGASCSTIVSLAGFAAAVFGDWIGGSMWVSIVLAFAGVLSSVAAAVQRKKVSSEDESESSESD